MSEQKKKYKRIHDIQLLFMVDEKERQLITKRMKEAGICSFRAFILKAALNGRIISVKLESVDEMVRLLSDATNNINQIAHRVNETGNIYPIDIDNVNKIYEELYEQTEVILQRLNFASK